MPQPDVRTTAYTLRPDATPHTVWAAYRGALIVLRGRLEDISIDVCSDRPWPDEALDAVRALQQRLRPRRRILPWHQPKPNVTVDLDPSDDDDFGLALAIAPYTIGGTGIADDGSIAWDGNDTGTSCTFDLTEKEHVALLDYLRAEGVDATSLVRSRRGKACG